MSSTATATAQYVYGILPAADAAGWADITGIDSAPVRAVDMGGFAALVSALPRDHTPGRREDIEAHRRVLAAAIEHGTAIPMRFGIVMDDEDTVRRRLLEGHAGDLEGLLRTLNGRVQFTVRGFYAEDALLRAVIADDEDLARRYAAIDGLPEVATRTERIALGELVAKAVEQRRAVDEQALLSRLSAVAADVRSDPPSSDRVALNAHLLVDRDRRAAIEELVGTLSAWLAGYVALRLIGPLPPYSFAAVSLEDETA
jgi:gas vesicle protein GvpL/GvpF